MEIASDVVTSILNSAQKHHLNTDSVQKRFEALKQSSGSSSFVSWDFFVDACQLLEDQAISTAVELELAQNLLIYTNRKISWLYKAMGYLFSPLQLYKLGYHIIIPRDFPILDRSLTVEKDGRVTIRLSIPYNKRPNPIFFKFSKFAMQKAPTLFGLKDGIVESVVNDHHGAYTVTLPPSKSILARFTLAFTALTNPNRILTTLYKKDLELQIQYQELLHSQAQLKKAHQDLEARIQERTLELATAKEKAEEANTKKIQFIANLSHEIRNPLTSIIGFAELMNSPHISDDKKMDYCKKLQQNAIVLSQLIRDLLDLSTIELGKFNITKKSLTLLPFLETLTQDFKDEAENKSIRFSVLIEDSIPLHINTDETRLRQVLSNLINNAIKYTEQGEIIAHSFGEADRNNKNIWVWCFDVTDTGIGLDEQDFQDLFQPFQRGQNTKAGKKYPGSGLGLALSRGLSQALGGQIELVKSEKGKGSTFRFKLYLGERAKISLLADIVEPNLT